MDGRKRLDLNLLVTLETLLIEQNVTRAAERLSLSQPAVSAQLARLREIFDDPLLIPVQRGMRPTAKAQELLHPLRQSLDQVRDVLEEHRHFNPETAELTVSIACTDYLQVTILQSFVLALRKRAPGVRIAMRHLRPSMLEEQTARGEVDLVLMTPAQAPASLRCRHLFDERYVLIGRERHPGLRRDMSIAQCAALEYVVVSPDGGAFSTVVDDGLAAMGLQRQVALSASSFLFVPQLVAQSDLVALVPSRLVQDRRDGLKVVEPPFAVPGFAVGMLWHERNHGHSGHRWVREFLLAQVSGA